MPKNKSEQLAAQLFRRAFLRMYVSVNPQIEVAGNPSAFELCDVLISFHGLVILAEVKEFNEVIGQSAPEKWLRNRVFREARFQLTRGVKALTESSYRVFDMKTKATIDLGNVEAIMTAVVFFRNDVENYDYRRALPEEEGFCGVNIFSSVDFKLALEQIPTPLDFFRYLEKRYLALKTGEHLYPVVETPRGIHLLPIDGITDEKILIADYLYNHTKNHDGDTKAARALIRAAERMSDNWGDVALLQVMSLIDLETAQFVEDIRGDLAAGVKRGELRWDGRFIQSGFDDGKIGIAIGYFGGGPAPMELIEKSIPDLVKIASPMGIASIFAFIFHDGGWLEIRTVFSGGASGGHRE